MSSPLRNFPVAAPFKPQALDPRLRELLSGETPIVASVQTEAHGRSRDLRERPWMISHSAAEKRFPLSRG
ncbi:hypothetical protein [Stenotrophomonas sp. MMGLT7]|uniref:hypothetical protein n=1 Tax=Stenotrophomonas sp. MMGLT7 TaxID=2901227 RepID=UPI001E390654|nr:hypothetical protein [Stenotrophomonas sp. MMGLT7]